MKNPFKAGSRPHRIAFPRAVRNSSPQRSSPQVEQFPSTAGPVAAMVLIGVAILIATAALWAWSGQRTNPSASVSVDPAAAGADIAANAGETANAPSEPAVEAQEPAVEEPATRASDLVRGAPAETVETETAQVEPARSETDARAEEEAAAPRAEAAARQSETVAVAETVDEILAQEAIQQREVEADLAGASNETTAAIAPPSAPKVQATATAWVNLRAGPSDDAEVLMVVPGNAEIEAESGCNWCAVTYDGRDGYIYKNFISYE